MTREEIHAVVHGYHGDPFRILGPHRVDGENRWEVRAFLPQAVEALVAIAAKTFPMERRDDQGFFVAQLAEAPGHYRLRLKL